MSAVSEPTAARLRATLAQRQRAGRLPSVAAAVTRDRELVWRESWGGATGHAGTGAVDLQYRVGSLTKVMTAVLVLQLCQEGLVDLADPVTATLPELDGLDHVTLRGLLGHTAGLPAEPPGDWWERSPGRDARHLIGLVKELAGSAGSLLPPQTAHHYSNLGYGLLGEVVARVRGCSWWECLSARLLEPLSMLRTTYDPFAPHARGYSVHPYSGVLAEEPAPDTGAMAPAGQLWSTVLDLATFADFLLFGAPQVLAERWWREMATPQTGTAADGLRVGYGLGLRLLPGGSGTLVGHGGSMPGFQASLFVDRERRTGAVVLANGTSGLASEEAAPALLATLEEAEPTAPAPWVPTTSVPAEVAAVLGPWHWGNTALVGTWDGARLLLGPAAGPGRASTFVLRDGRLVGENGYHAGEPLHVVRREDGTVSHLEVSTFVLTRIPYDPNAPIPGGPPRR